DGAGGDDTDKAVQQLQIVLVEDGAVVAGVIAQQHQLMAALAQRQEEGQEAAEDVEPGREALDSDDGDTGGDAQDKSCRHNGDVHKDDVLQPEGVGDLQDEVDQQNQAEPCREIEAGEQAAQGEDDGGNQRHARVQASRRQGA